MSHQHLGSVSHHEKPEHQEEIVKVYLIDGSHKSAHINPYRTTVEELWEIIGDKLGLSIEVGVNFFLWGCEDDLELLLYSDATIHDVKVEWPKWYQQYSNTEKKDRKGNFKFLFKPTCVVPLRSERNAKSVEGTNLFYLQAAHNVVESYYPCDLEMAIKLAGVQAGITLGDRNPVVHRPGYLKKSIHDYIPEHLRNSKKIEEWESLVYDEQEKYNGKEKYIKQMLYLQLVRQWSYYGCTFFRAKYKPPTQGFYRQEFYGKVVIGVNGYGVHVIDPNIMKIISVEFDQVVHPVSNSKTFQFDQRFKDKKTPSKKFGFKTNQGDLIVDLIYEWFSEYKKQKTEIEQTKLKQTHLYESPSQIQ